MCRNHASQICHAVNRLLAALLGVNGAWINQVLTDWNCSKLSRGKASETFARQRQLIEDLRLDGHRTSEAEEVLQRFETAYQTLLTKLNALSSEGSPGD